MLAKVVNTYMAKRSKRFFSPGSTIYYDLDGQYEDENDQTQPRTHWE